MQLFIYLYLSTCLPVFVYLSICSYISICFSLLQIYIHLSSPNSHSLTHSVHSDLSLPLLSTLFTASHFLYTHTHLFFYPHPACEHQRTLLEHRAREAGIPAGRVYLPECDAEGAFLSTQCHPATLTCWCVDTQGQEVPGTRVSQPSHPDCQVRRTKRLS